MNFEEYQKRALMTNLTKEDEFKELMQQVLGLADEAGEVQSLFKKWIRDDNADFSRLKKEKISKELGDVLWYVAVIAHDVGINLNEIAEENIEKLHSRMKRGKLGGDGDDR